MSNPYLNILKQQQSYKFAFGALAARAQMSMYGFGIFIMMGKLSDDATLGPFLAAVYYLGLALFSPQVAKLIDRFGQTPVLRIILALNFVALSSLLLCIQWQLPAWTLYLSCAALSVLPSVGTLSRARWIHLYAEKPGLSTAFSLEALFDEMSFLIGPPLAVILSGSLFPSAGVLVAWCLFTIGTITMLAHKTSEPKPKLKRKPAATKRFSFLNKLPLLSLIAFSLILGITFGTVEIMSIKFAQFHGFTTTTGAILLSCYSIGSLVSGYIYGLKKRGSSIQQQFFLWASIKAALCIMLWFIPNVWLMGIFLAFYGSALAPVITLLLRLVSETVDPDNITEGMSWISSGINLGGGGGMALAGWVIAAPHLGPNYGFSINFIAGFILLAMVVILMKTLGSARSAK